MFTNLMDIVLLCTSPKDVDLMVFLTVRFLLVFDRS